MLVRTENESLAMNHRLPRIAVIDTQLSFLEGAELWFTHARPGVAEIRTANSWAAFMQDRDSLDAAVLDMDLDGTPLIYRIRSLHADGIKVIVTGSRPRDEQIKSALDLGAEGYVCKTEGMSGVYEAVLTALRGGIYSSTKTDEKVARAESVEAFKPSPQGKAVLALVASGLSNDQVAHQLGLSKDTVPSYLKTVRARALKHGLKLEDKIDVFKYAFRTGLVAA
jgi:DNA-binding NarL/FixJ family response regulator